MNDPASKGPLLLFSTEGGMDIEDVAAEHPDKLVRLPIDLRRGVDAVAVADALGGLGLGDRLQPVAATLAKLRSEEPTSDLHSLLRTSYAVFCLPTHSQPSSH